MAYYHIFSYPIGTIVGLTHFDTSKHHKTILQTLLSLSLHLMTVGSVAAKYTMLTTYRARLLPHS